MDTTYWRKQGNKPLFPELEWNKPERRDQAGRLLIAGGNIHHLNAPAKAYEITRHTGIGEAKIVLPGKTKRLIGKVFPEAIFLPSTNSGEFAQEGISELLKYAQWADTMLLPGDTGRNSQTTILLEQLLRTYNSHIVITRDSVDTLQNSPRTLLERPHTTLVISFSQLQKALQNYHYPEPLSFTMDLIKLVELLHTLTLNLPVSFITLHQNQLIAASGGLVSTTKRIVETEPLAWRLMASTIAACYLTWNPTKIFESLTQAAFLVDKK